MTLPNTSPGDYDAIIVGGGHNCLVAAAYLGKAGLKVLVLEARDRMGGPAGTYEFMPGYKAAFTNSPGSLEPKVVQELDLEGCGLRFVRPDPTLIHHFPDRCFVASRDRAAVEAQLEAFSPGEAGRYQKLFASFDVLAQAMGISLFEPAPSLSEIGGRLKTPETRALFDKLFIRSLKELLDEALKSDQAKALLGMVALNANLTPPSAPGTAVGLMLRPLSLVSMPAGAADDPRRVALRGSTGLPVGGMGAIIDALVTSCRKAGVELRSDSRVARILHDGGKVAGVATADGKEYRAPVVVSGINPRFTFRDLLDDETIGEETRREIGALPMRGSAFKMALALDGLPRYAGLPEGISQEQAAATQLRICPSLDYLEASVADGLAGVPSQAPIIWGLMPSVTSPGMAPQGKHILSLNVWHAPYDLREGDWSSEKDRFAKRCIETLAWLIPDIEDRIIDTRCFGPREIEDELGLVGSNITHGDMMPGDLFGSRPNWKANDYRTPLTGLYLTGAGTWPGGYVTGIPGHNASQAVLQDLQKTRR